ncbi:MAG: ISAs1 family transposase [Candidatus Thiodiazotropha sp. (ex Lucinoma aequizonata)]|nr:ISAs1 family transposase [Candidatus Thiodiazotropha sp. (ex Lucinoma aequizonata)]MCU7895869.1 ISAs1 family transposase [Candidatus Thiodiazotropha sp. (ex Lucinoma aequizonata)]MCU7910291.1 ISAs1 family transposase [Candidatus Thiodiazotropha sp. (ex Lucinoma aequizonata)]
MLDAIEIEGRTVTADALLTQRDLAQYLVEEKGANYHFTVKGNQSALLEAIAFFFQSNPNVADFTQIDNGEHGRIETRKIWVTIKLNHYLDFSHVSQAFMIEREPIDKKPARPVKRSFIASPVHRRTKQTWNRFLQTTESKSCHYIIDWNFDGDRSQIRTGFGPENITRLRRFAIGLLKSKKSNETIPEMIKKLLLNTRAVFDYLKMTRNSNTLSMS